ncbi:hypothetical protein F5X98DRAFT_374097 [Xylaria grammica]|nr:hypothetical protein F5X98DRAFT_374097 [Xylaria grammica]
MSPYNVHTLPRSPYKSPISLDGNPRKWPKMIRFLHPRKPDGQEIISFPALDLGTPIASPSSQSSACSQNQHIWGVDYETALVACGILANNRWDGYFTSADSGKRVENTTRLLEEPRYFFNVPSADSSHPSNDTINDYAVIRDFASWRFPHGDLPPLWRFSMPEDSNTNTSYEYNPFNFLHYNHVEPDGGCAITPAHQQLKNFYIVPTPYTKCFYHSRMARHLTPLQLSNIENDIDNVHSRLLMRVEDHSLIEEGRFCVVPKAATPNATSTSEPQNPKLTAPVYETPGAIPNVNLVLCILDPNLGNEPFVQYHNMSLEWLRDVKPEELFAAFAEKIFNMSRYFKKDSPTRKAVQVIKPDGGSPAYGGIITATLPTESRRKRKRIGEDDSCDSTDSEDASEEILKRRKYNKNPILRERGRTLRRSTSVD